MRRLATLAVSCLAWACGPSPALEPAFTNAAQIPNLTSLSVRHDGAIVREQFFAGTAADTPHDVRSVTKTVTSLLIGIALDRGCLTSLDQTLGELLGPQAPSDPAKAAITVRDLLTMSSGFQWDESGAVGDYNAWARAPDQVAFLLARPLVSSPGTVFNYNSGALHLLSVILTRACQPTADFAAQTLFAALGIQSRPWETDSAGVTNGAAGLQVTTSEMASLGELLLNDGKMGNTQVVSSSYVTAATSAQIATGDSTYDTPSYGYGAWIGQTPQVSKFVLAEGYGGQMIWIVPDKRLVVVATANWQQLGQVAVTDYNQIWSLVVDQILPKF